MADPGSRPLVIWVVTDGTAGHENQSLGLAEALARVAPATIHRIAALPFRRAAAAWLFRHALADGLPPPDLLVGAGHRTHPTLLALARTEGAKTVVLMSPTLPRRCFDLCIVPEHDGIAPSPHTLVTLGALNRVRPAAQSDPGLGLFLIGGPSPHFAWSDSSLLQQIDSVVSRTPGIRWTLTDSRRTPAGFLRKVRPQPNLERVSHKDTPSGWLPERLQHCATVWVSPDSVSMVFEALTAGAGVGLFDLAARARSRVAGAVAQLDDRGYVTAFRTWAETGRLRPRPPPLAEADRCAAWIIEWLKKAD